MLIHVFATRPSIRSARQLNVHAAFLTPLALGYAPRRRRHGQNAEQRRSRDPQIGTTTPVPEDAAPPPPTPHPFYFSAGYAAWAKRPPRPFPPPFFSPPSGSFSDPLSTHNRSADRRTAKIDGEIIRGVTNGDDALLVSERFIGANDGVGAWAKRERGHAGLWSRLLLHFWAGKAEDDGFGQEENVEPNPVRYLSEAYEMTKDALGKGPGWLGTTTASAALLHYVKQDGDVKPLVYITQLGDSKVMIVRPEGKEILFETEEQWHYFDCPRQLGTNSPDTPEANAVLSKQQIREHDLVLALTDGVTDNMWPEEISETAIESLEAWQEKAAKGEQGEEDSDAECMRYVAQELVLAARKVAEDPFAASPFMERAVEEGLAIEGGKLDDISVVAAVCKRRKG